MTENEKLWARRLDAIPRGVGSMHQRTIVRAENAELWDADGKRYIDFASGIAVLNTGHNHPTVMARVNEQLKAFSHTSFQVNPYEVYIELAERLNALAPGKSKKKTIFFTTGAEAVENAVKIARVHTKRSAIIAFKGAFHGRTMMTLALTGKVKPYKEGFGPFPPEIYHLPFPVKFHGVSEEDSLNALQDLFKSDVEPERVAAIIIEPVQGEGGFYPASPAFLISLRAICDKHGIVFICDEIQSGFARTGKMFAIEHAGVEPDLITVAKSIAGGMPLSGVIGKADIMDAPGPGGLGGTYGGPPAACAAGLGVLRVIEEEKLCSRAEMIGALIEDRLVRLRKHNQISCIGDIRRLGAMAALELSTDGDPHKPDASTTAALVKDAAENGLILLSCGIYGNVIRFLAPLTASEDIVSEGLDIFEQSFLNVTRS
jgi:4-aminobutyrate aminotransferase/(S)-3-amino-2-methylpropionate transaminase